MQEWDTKFLKPLFGGRVRGERYWGETPERGSFGQLDAASLPPPSDDGSAEGRTPPRRTRSQARTESRGQPSPRGGYGGPSVTGLPSGPAPDVNIQLQQPFHLPPAPDKL